MERGPRAAAHPGLTAGTEPRYAAAPHQGLVRGTHPRVGPSSHPYAHDVLRLIAFAALGSFLGGVVVALVGPPGTGITIAGVSFAVLVFATAVTGVAGTLGTGTGASPKAVQQARDARRLGLARVDALRTTSTEINDQPLCDIDVTVQPLTGTAYATTVRTVVPPTVIPLFQPGAEREVVILLDGGPELAFVEGELSPGDHDRLTVPPRASVPLLPVQPHTRIVDGRRKGPLLGVSREGRPLRVALYAVVALAAAAVVLAPHRAAVAQTVTSSLGAAHDSTSSRFVADGTTLED